jgi:uncharacterized damage-inducible protein DinB
MSEHNVTVADVYAGWGDFHHLLVKAVRPLTPEQLDLRAAPHLRTLRTLAAHIVRTRISWFQGLMGMGGAEYEELATFDRPDKPAWEAAELVRGMEASWRLVQDSLGGWTIPDLQQIYEGSWQDEPYSLTRQWVIQHVLEHDHVHGGELALTLGIYGLPAPEF